MFYHLHWSLIKNLTYPFFRRENTHFPTLLSFLILYNLKALCLSFNNFNRVSDKCSLLQTTYPTDQQSTSVTFPNLPLSVPILTQQTRKFTTFPVMKYVNIFLTRPLSYTSLTMRKIFTLKSYNPVSSVIVIL